MDDEIKEKSKEILKNISKIVTKNDDGTYTVKMPTGVEDYIIKDLTRREEQACKKLATNEIPEEDMILIRSVVKPKISTDQWLNLPSKICKRLEYVRRYLDGEFDFLI